MENDLVDIREEMLRIGKKYSEIAQTATSIKHGKAAFYIARDAYSMVLQMSKSQGSVVDNTSVVFLARIEQDIPRPRLWEDYLLFCLRHNLQPMQKSVLFTKLFELDFQVRRTNGQVIVRPPEDRQALIRAARSFERLKIIDASFSSVSPEDDQSTLP